jgi:hypothetical protein
MNVCEYCERSFSNRGGLCSHEPYCRDNPIRIKRKWESNTATQKGSVPWNKGKTGVQVAWNKGTTGISGGRASTPDKENLRKKRISESMKKFGGYRKGSGRGKKGWYKGFFCDSSWELAYVIYCLDHSIHIERNTTKLKYVFENKNRSYTPDFLVEGVLTEVKGFKSPQWEAKLKYNPYVRVLYEAEMKPIIEYVESTYGRDFIRMYE